MSSVNYFVYIITNSSKTVLYTGVTNDLYTRMLQHRQNKGNAKSFAGKYYCHILVYYERFTNVESAIEREKDIENMSRVQKEELVKSMNPNWYKLLVY